MADSPITAVLRAMDALDVDATAALFADSGSLMRTDGRRAHGREEVRAAIADFFSQLHATTHEVTAEWHPEPDVWVAQLSAHYEVKDLARYGPYYRAIVLRDGPDGILELSIYGSHEPAPAAAEHKYREVYAAGHWMPTL
jgi:ketosteroid isomerase-like protein